MSDSDDKISQFYTEEVPVSHPTDSLLLDWTARIRAGERSEEIDGIARYIIKDFRLRQMLDVPQSPITMEWIGSALDSILEYETVEQAFALLPRPKQRPRDIQKDMDIACWVAVAQLRGYEQPEAFALASDTFHTDISNVRRKVRDCPLDWINPSDEFWEHYFIGKNKPLPSK